MKNNIKHNFLNKKINKCFISFLWIILLLIWGVIPTIVCSCLNINVNDLSYTTKIVISFINDILFLFLLIWCYRKTLKEDMIKYFKHNFKSNFKLSISYWLFGLGIMVISNLIIGIVMNGQLANNEEAVRTLVDNAPLYMVFQLVIYAPLSEELIFRKSIRDAVSNKLLFAIVSGVVFGGLHAISSITSLASLLYLIPYCSLGIAFGLLYAKSDNIFSTMSVHAIHNFIALMLYLGVL